VVTVIIVNILTETPLR